MKIAYSAYLGSHIKTKIFITNGFWFFTKCNEHGEVTGKVMKAGSRHDCFNWKRPKNSKVGGR